MDNDIDDIRNIFNDAISNIVCNCMSLAYGYRSVHDDMQINLDAGTDISGTNCMSIQNAFDFERALFDAGLDFFGGAHINQFADTGPDDLDGRMQDKYGYDDGSDTVQKRPAWKNQSAPYGNENGQ